MMIRSNRGKIEDNKNPDWLEALCRFENAIASETEAMQVKAVISLAKFSKTAPNLVLARTIPILAKLLVGSNSNGSIQPIQEAAAYCFKCIAYKGKAYLLSEICQSGALDSVVSLLPHSSNGFRIIAIKFIRVLVNFHDASRLVVARDGGLETIISVLTSSSNRDYREKIYLLEILSALALLREVRRVLSRLGGLRFLVEAVSCGSIKSRERASQSIGLLGVSRRGRSALVALGAIPVLVQLFGDGDWTTKIVAGNSLGVISAHMDFIRPVAEAGAIPLYAELLQGPDPIGKEIAEDAFCILAVAEVNALAVAEHLVRILREGDDGAKVAASDIFWDLSGYKHSVSVVRNSGAIPVLVELLRNGNSEVIEKISGAVAQLSYNEADRVALADAGVVPILIRLLHHELEELKDNAAEALVNFAEDPQQRSIISEAVDVPSFQNMQNRLARLRVSEEQLARSLRGMRAQQFTWDPALS